MRAEWRFDSDDFASLRATRGSAIELLRRNATASADIDACAVVLSELISNAALHAPSGSICVAIDWTEPSPLFAVTDPGGGFTPKIDLPPATSEGGRGLFLVENLAATPRVDVDERGCTVSVRLPIARL
ncbi:MAG: ATP-binding protein [Candidatus Eremiobacteraeota bacterium]|nr:ATP-binding protein [Candidatus Eremiobacteraeota bacterium]